MGLTRSGVRVSAQIAKCGDFAELNKANFKTENRDFFNIKNDGDEAVFLNVKFANNDEFQTWKFYPGWNPEIVKEVEQTSSDVSNLKWGY